jgi:hypothetical protein
MEFPNRSLLTLEFSKLLNIGVAAFLVSIVLECVGILSKEKYLCRKVQNIT